jgi:hypothetical protein
MLNDSQINRMKRMGWFLQYGKWSHPGWRGHYLDFIAFGKSFAMEHCRHQFIEPNHCLKCGWVPNPTKPV